MTGHARAVGIAGVVCAGLAGWGIWLPNDDSFPLPDIPGNALMESVTPAPLIRSKGEAAPVAFSALYQRPLFREGRQGIVAARTVPAGTPGSPGAPNQVLGGFVLYGTVIGGTAAQSKESIVLLGRLGEAATETLHVGEVVGDWTLVQVLPSRAIFERESERTVLQLYEDAR